jgi:sec-independent protein translocase protein TatB
MEILGIGPGEFILILIMLLVVVGPERLPGLARQVGGFLVRARNWLQTSPDAALVMRARAEIEAELASIKTSLMEVQVVRDEVLGAAKQLEDSVGSISPPKFDLNSLVNPPAEQTVAADGQILPAGETPGLVLPDGTNAPGTALDQLSTLELPNGSSVPIPPPAEAQPTNGLAHSLANGSSASEPTVAASAAPALGADSCSFRCACAGRLGVDQHPPPGDHVRYVGVTAAAQAARRTRRDLAAALAGCADASATGHTAGRRGASS